MPSRPVLIGRGLVTPHHTRTRPNHHTHSCVNWLGTDTSGNRDTPPRTTNQKHQHSHRSKRDRASAKTHASTIQNLNQQTHRSQTHGYNKTTVHNVTAAIAARKHPDPSRTRKLSQPAPMVLHPTGCGRVGRRRTTFRRMGTIFVMVPIRYSAGCRSVP